MRRIPTSVRAALTTPGFQSSESDELSNINSLGFPDAKNRVRPKGRAETGGGVVFVINKVSLATEHSISGGGFHKVPHEVNDRRVISVASISIVSPDGGRSF
ncbi:MAG: hypothetical protein AAFU85_13935 [Planctomycetota bacterium]